VSADTCGVAQVVALHDASSVDAAIIYTMEPVMGAALSWALLGERWGKLGFFGAGLIIASSLAAQLFPTHDEEAEEKEA
jgi:drug/metabolite transporter (DMT)-like permease